MKKEWFIMKTALGRRWLALLLTLALALTLAPAAFAEGESEQPRYRVELSATDTIILERDGPSRTLTARTDAPGAEIQWVSSAPAVASVSRGSIYPLSPGRTEITAYVDVDGVRYTSDPVAVEVSGMKLSETSISLEEDAGKELPVPELFGVAAGKTVSWMSNDPSVAEINGYQVMGRAPGTTTLEVSVGGGLYPEKVTVNVSAGRSTIDLTGSTMSVNDTLSFGAISSRIAQQVSEGERLSHITGLRVDTAQGTLYYQYRSEAEPGAGVAQEGSYYLSPGTGQRGLSDITFVPKPAFTGGTVTISYTAVSNTYSNRQCRILLTVAARNSVPLLTLTTPYDTPIKLSGAEFDRICQEFTGVGLDTVTFVQPSGRQGTLYTDYVAPGNYGSVVSTSRMYDRKELDNIWFVPAAGVTGPVTVSYTARGRGASGSAYAGVMTITVGGRDAVEEGGPSYVTASGGPVTFDDQDFENYRRQVLPNGNTLSYIQFDSLPDVSQGILYYDYRSAGSPGSYVGVGSSYYYNARSPRLDRLTFVPAESFTGTVRIPFTAWDRDGSRFSGWVEIAVRGSSGRGDIRYTCSPGRSVSFINGDFTSLCRELTGRSLNYIVLQGLPDRYTEGTVYHNTNSLASAGTRYYAGSSSPYRISRLSFRAASGFFGSADIPFVGYANNGDSFDGVITISSNGVADWTIYYRSDGGSAAVFNRDDFDSLSQWENRENVRSVRFQIPAASQGDLYSGYRSSSNPGQRLSSGGTAVSRSALNQVAFVPARNYTGTVYIDFTATSDYGEVFRGTVEITVERDTADGAARYYTRGAPVQFNGQDFRQDSRALSSIRLNALPSADQGRLYYRYTSPLRHEREADTRTSYRTGGSSLISDLTFVPRAGYTGTVVLPYTGTNANGSTFAGVAEITVNPARSSEYFSDMGPYSDEQRAAVDFCRENNITRGMSSTQFGPESSIRRGDFALMLYRAMELTPRYNSRPFQDVSSDAYYSEAVDTLRAMGVVSGVGGGRYNPGGTLSRQDAVCMVQRAMRELGLGGYDGSAVYLNGYSDSAQVAGYAQGAMAYAVQQGYLPTRGGRLEPYQPLSRVDMAQMLHRVLTY